MHDRDRHESIERLLPHSESASVHRKPAGQGGILRQINGARVPRLAKVAQLSFPTGGKSRFLAIAKNLLSAPLIEHGSAGPAASNEVKLARLQSRCGFTTERTAEPQSYQRAKRPRGFESIDQALLSMAARPKCGRREKELLQKSRI
jgi:hypothetical protein